MDKRYEIVHNGAIYHAVLRESYWWGEKIYDLCIWYDADWFKQEEFHNIYKTLRGAKNKLKKYFKGEGVEWSEIIC